MKKYIIAALLVLLLPTVSYAKCCNCCQKDIPLMNITYVGTMTITDTGIKKLIGKMVHRTKPCVTNTSSFGSIDSRFMHEPKKLMAVTDKHLIFESTVFTGEQFEIGRDIWDDGNWEEWIVKHKRLTVIELVDNETFVAVWGESSSRYYCVKCGKKLSGWMGLNNYRCPACRAEFNIKEEE